MFSAFKNTAKQGVTYGIGEIAYRVVGFLLIPIYTRVLSTSDFGKWGVLNTVNVLIAPVIVLGLSSSIFRSLHDYEEGSQKIVIGTTLSLLLPWILCAIVGGYFLSPFFSQLLFGDRNDAMLVFIVVLLTGFSGLQSIPLALFRARGKPKQYVVFVGIGVFFKTILTIFLVVVLKWGLYGVLWGDCLSYVLLTIMLFWHLRSEIGLEFHSSEAKRLLIFGLPLVGASVANVVYTRSDMFFLTKYSGLDEVGVYNLAIQIGTVLQTLVFRPLSLLWLPLVLLVSREKFADEYYSRVFVYVFILISYLGTATVVFGDEIVAILGGGGAYSRAIQVLTLVVLAQIIYVSQATFSVGINLKRQTWVYPIVSLITAFFAIGFNFLLIPRIGIIGAGAASVLSNIVYAAGIYFSSGSFYRVSYDWKRVAKVSLSLILVVLLAYIAGNIPWIVLRLLVKLLILLAPLLLLNQGGFLLKDESQVLRSKLYQLIPHHN